MLIFITTLSYLIVKYKAFNIKLAGAQALVFALWFLVGSLLFVAKSPTTRVISGITLLITSVAGYLLVRSVKHEIQQREKIQELAENLAQANIHLKELDRMKSEFVSIASHQLRSPLTSIRGYASMLKEGTYGKMPQTAIPVLENIAESSHFMAQSVEDYLNVSRIEAGNMKYELSDFSIKEQAEKITDELRQVAIKKGLALLFRSDISGSGRIHADIGKVRQVLMNLIDNSMKYTPKGSIDVLVHDDPKKKRVTVSIVDTGIGMDTHTVGEVFEKFVRAKNANCVNVTGTGLGLYVAKKMVDEMKGVIWAESDGPNKGSRFHLEFPEI
ncbi:MAG TPA: HAMP domain-containing sensor histidine kinase [Candidatus Paceibacterota bacterium]|nr:HAMP domain-containing sensor histidine kinase [Candidatus Paceibacterota bacterium]